MLLLFFISIFDKGLSTGQLTLHNLDDRIKSLETQIGTLNRNIQVLNDQNRELESVLQQKELEGWLSQKCLIIKLFILDPIKGRCGLSYDGKFKY